jgi:hypothetical protein
MVLWIIAGRRIHRSAANTEIMLARSNREALGLSAATEEE